jgi:hypothetical protein
MSELARISLGFLLATVVPAYLPGSSAHVHRRALLAAGLLLVTLLPASPGPEIWALAVLAVAFSAAVPPASALLPAGVVVLVALAAVLQSAGETWEAVESVASNDDVLLVVAGWAVAAFGGGAVVGWMTRPFASTDLKGADEADITDPAPATPEGHPGAGRLIGWLERTLIFGFVVAGKPEAAVIVFAAKSIARFASLDDRRFAEYYLIGSLASLLIAVGAGVAVEAAI